MTSLLQKINKLNVRVDNVSTSGGTTDTTALQAQVDTNTSDISGIQTNKQNTLTAGDNITIVDNVISASGGGGTTIGSTTDLSCNTLTTVGNISCGGIISAPNQVAFKATTTGFLRVINNGAIPDFENVLFNIGGGYDNTTYKFTAPVAGKYLFCVVFYTNSNNTYTLDLLLNDTTIITRVKRQQIGTGGYTIFQLDAFENLNVGDVVYSIVKQNTSIAINLANETSFFGFLIV